MGVSMPRPRLRGYTAAVKAPAWRWDLARRLPHPFKEARTPWSLQGDSWPAHSCALVMADVARHRVAMLAPALARAAR